jgi:hypothetical protein
MYVFDLRFFIFNLPVEGVRALMFLFSYGIITRIKTRGDGCGISQGTSAGSCAVGGSGI